MLPRSVRESGAIVTILVAAILAGPLRAAFLKPLFLIMMMVRFHALIENQPINQEWDARLATISDKFRDLGTQARRDGAGAPPAQVGPGDRPGGSDRGGESQGRCVRPSGPTLTWPRAHVRTGTLAPR